MAVSRAMRRLLRIRALQEEQSRIELDSAFGELAQLEQALKAAAERGVRGRGLIGRSAFTGELADRLSGVEEEQSAGRHAAALRPRIAGAEAEVADLRLEFLERRVERRQAETLIEETEARHAIESDRGGQQALDDWFGAKRQREAAETTRPAPPQPGKA